METFEITSAKTKGDLFCHYGYRIPIGKDSFDTGTVKSERPMHDDLKKAFSDFTVHLPMILQDLKPGDIEDVNSGVNNFKGVEGLALIMLKYTLLGVDIDMDNNKVSLIGAKQLDLGILPINTPYIPLSGGSYHYELELKMAVDALRHEVNLYIEGKQAPVFEQGELFGSGSEAPVVGEGGEPAPDGKGKKGKGGRKKKELTELEIANQGNGETLPLSEYYVDPSESKSDGDW